MTINYISLCSGYGAECLAFKRLMRDHPEAFGFNLIAWAEIEPYACAAHDALHADADRNLGDITAVDWKQWHESIGNPHVDLLFASTPCQSVSTAGKQEGMKKGTDAASALIWATEQCIATLLPDFIIYENVKGLISKRNMPDFMEFCATIEKYGYRHMYKVFNAKDFGVPQNRERVFPIFYRDPEWQYEYPKPFPLVKRLRDVLEENVDESYYLKDEQVRRILAHCDRKQAEGCGFKTQFTTPDKVCGTIMSNYGQRETDPYVKIDKAMIPINTASDGCASAITAHYHKCGASDFRPHGVDGNHMSNTAVLEVTEDPKVMQIGSYSPSSQCNAKVLDSDGICPALLDHKGAEPAIVEPVSCAMRGRGEGWKQQLEFGGRIANSLTSVQTDSLVAEPIKIRQATAQGYIECPVGGGFDAVYPNSRLRRGRVQDNGDVIGAITAQGDAHCVYEGAEVIEPLIQPLIPWNRPGKPTSICQTITSGGAWEHNNVVIEPTSRKDDITFKQMPDGNIHAYRANDPKKSTAPEWQITNADNVHPTLTTSHEPKVLLRYRIRKLTPTECFRLMGMDDADIDKIEAYRVKTVLKSGKVKEKPIPKTAKYKLAGNSIVVDVLYHLFRNMFIPDYSAQPKRHEPSLADFW